VTVEQLEQELAYTRSHLRELAEQEIAECEGELAYETDPYYRKMLQSSIELFRTLGH
jgi:hypothetical protein